MSSQQRTCINGDSSGEERTKGSNGPVGAPPEARTAGAPRSARTQKPSTSSSSLISPNRSPFWVAGAGGGGGGGRRFSWRRWSCWEREDLGGRRWGIGSDWRSERRELDEAKEKEEEKEEQGFRDSLKLFNDIGGGLAATAVAIAGRERFS